MRLVRCDPDEIVLCMQCEHARVRSVSDRLLRLALGDRSFG